MLEISTRDKTRSSLINSRVISLATRNLMYIVSMLFGLAVKTTNMINRIFMKNKVFTAMLRS